MKRIYFPLVFVMVTTQLIAQEHNHPEAKNALSIDCETIYFTGSYAINYERKIYSKHGFMSNINLGFGMWSTYVNKRSVNLHHFASSYSIPITINSITGSGCYHFEFDFGIRYLFNKTWRIAFDNGIEFPKPQFDQSKFLPVYNFGYRYQNRNGGVFFRAFFGSEGIGFGLGHAF